MATQTFLFPEKGSFLDYFSGRKGLSFVGKLLSWLSGNIDEMEFEKGRNRVIDRDREKEEEEGTL